MNKWKIVIIFLLVKIDSIIRRNLYRRIASKNFKIY